MTDKLQKIKDKFESSVQGVWMDKSIALCDSRLFNKALTALNSYMEARDSEDMVERVAKAIAHELDGMSEKYYTHAKAAIKAMEGE